jgi:hypothetical protein
LIELSQIITVSSALRSTAQTSQPDVKQVQKTRRCLLVNLEKKGRRSTSCCQEIRVSHSMLQQSGTYCWTTLMKLAIQIAHPDSLVMRERPPRCPANRERLLFTATVCRMMTLMVPELCFPSLRMPTAASVAGDAVSQRFTPYGLRKIRTIISANLTTDDLRLRSWNGSFLP